MPSPTIWPGCSTPECEHFFGLRKSTISLFLAGLVSLSPSIASGMPRKEPCRVILANGQGANPREMHIGQSGLLGPDIELCLHLGEVALRFDLLGDIKTGLAEAGDHVL